MWLISCLANGESKLNEWGVRLAWQAKSAGVWESLMSAEVQGSLSGAEWFITEDVRMEM